MSTEESGGNQEPLRQLLIIESSQALRQALRRFLVQHYDRVACAAGPEEGLELLGREPGAFGAVLTTLRFDGRRENLAYLAKLDEAAGAAAMVVISGAEPTEEEARWFAEHAVVFLPKPFEAQDLLEALQQSAGVARG